MCGAVPAADGERGRGWISRTVWAGLTAGTLLVIWLVGVRSSALGSWVRRGVSDVLSRRVIEATVNVVAEPIPTDAAKTIPTADATERTAQHEDPTETPTPTSAPTRTASATPSASVIATATLTASATASPTLALPSATPRIHVVVSGDYIEKLAVLYDVDQDAIAAANGITLETILQLGQELIIPVEGQSVPTTPVPTSTSTATSTAVQQADSGDPAGGALSTVAAPTASLSPTPTPTSVPAGRPATHTVAEGENLSYLAMKYDVSMQEIAEANEIAVSAILSIGQELVIPGLDATPTVTAQPTQTATPLATLTPTPTRVPTPSWLYVAPVPLYPPAGDVVPDEGGLLLAWTSAGVLAEKDRYLVDIQLQSDAFQPLERTELLTRATSVRVEIQSLGALGQGELLSWRVWVVRLGPDGREMVSPTSETRWLSVTVAGSE